MNIDCLLYSKPVPKRIKIFRENNYFREFIGVAPKGIDCSSSNRYGQTGGGYMHTGGTLSSGTAGKSIDKFT
jgi:hypothetical protein